MTNKAKRGSQDGGIPSVVKKRHKAHRLTHFSNQPAYYLYDAAQPY